MSYATNLCIYVTTLIWKKHFFCVSILRCFIINWYICVDYAWVFLIYLCSEGCRRKLWNKKLWNIGIIELCKKND